MKAIIIVLVCCATAFASEDYCYRDAVDACKTTHKKDKIVLNCTAKYGAIDRIQVDLQRYVKEHFIRSFEYLLMSTHFANYEKNRPGFEKLLRGLSDEKWHEGIELIQYITKRGGEMNFDASPDLLAPEQGRSYDLYELAAIARAVDIEKELTQKAHSIHGEALRRVANFHDPEISSHLEREFLHKQRDTIRKLAGFVTELNSLLKGPDSSLSLYLFDNYLQKE